MLIVRKRTDAICAVWLRAHGIAGFTVLDIGSKVRLNDTSLTIPGRIVPREGRSRGDGK